jgi:hypothetical protein
MAWTAIESKEDFQRLLEAARVSGDQYIVDGEEKYVLKWVHESNQDALREVLRKGGPLADDEDLGSA